MPFPEQNFDSNLPIGHKKSGLLGSVSAEQAIALDGQSVATINGAEIAISVVDGAVVINGSATVIQADVLASNGVIHVIDAVILPPEGK